MSTPTVLGPKEIYKNSWKHITTCRHSYSEPRVRLTAQAIATQVLRDPARLQGVARSTVHVVGHPNWSLESYMRLPTEQYSVLDPMITCLGNNRFRLRVPRLALFDLWVSPIVDVCVEQSESPPRVLLSSYACKLHGSEALRSLDRRVVVQFETQLTWHSSEIKELTTDENNRSGSITADVSVEVYTEVIPPFHFLPRSVLEGTANTALRALIHALLPLFLKRLAADYRRWSTDEEYRAKRAALAAHQHTRNRVTTLDLGQ